MRVENAFDDAAEEDEFVIHAAANAAQDEIFVFDMVKFKFSVEFFEGR